MRAGDARQRASSKALGKQGFYAQVDLDQAGPTTTPSS